MDIHNYVHTHTVHHTAALHIARCHTHYITTGPTLASWLPSVSVELPGSQNSSPGLDRNVTHEMYDSVSRATASP